MVGQSGRLVQEKLLQHFESISQHAFTMMWETLVASDRNVCMSMGNFEEAKILVLKALRFHPSRLSHLPYEISVAAAEQAQQEFLRTHTQSCEQMFREKHESIWKIFDCQI